MTSLFIPEDLGQYPSHTKLLELIAKRRRTLATYRFENQITPVMTVEDLVLMYFENHRLSVVGAGMVLAYAHYNNQHMGDPITEELCHRLLAEAWNNALDAIRLGS